MAWRVCTGFKNKSRRVLGLRKRFDDLSPRSRNLRCAEDLDRGEGFGNIGLSQPLDVIDTFHIVIPKYAVIPGYEETFKLFSIKYDA